MSQVEMILPNYIHSNYICSTYYGAWEDLRARAVDLAQGAGLNNNQWAVRAFLKNVLHLSHHQSGVLRALRTAIHRCNFPTAQEQESVSIISEHEFVLLTIRLLVMTYRHNLIADMLSQTPATPIHFAFVRSAEVVLDRRITLQCEHPITALQAKTRQMNFQQSLRETYGKEQPVDHNDKWVWDPILRSWTDKSCLEPIQLVPSYIGGHEYARLIGEDWCTDSTIYDLTWGAENGMLVPKQLKPYLENGSVIIVPTKKPHHTREYKLLVLNEACRATKITSKTLSHNGHEQITECHIGDLQLRKLHWINDNRPSPTALFMRYLISRLQRQRDAAPGYARDGDMVSVLSGPWKDVVPFRRTMLKQLSHELGDLKIGGKYVVEAHGEVLRYYVRETQKDRASCLPMSLSMAQAIIGGWVEEEDTWTDYGEELQADVAPREYEPDLDDDAMTVYEF